MPKKKWAKVWESEPNDILDLAQKYLQALKLKNYSPRTVETIKCRLNCFLLWVREVGIERVHKLTGQTLWDYQRYLLQLKSERTGGPLSQRGRKKYMEAACLFLRYLTKNDYLITDITRSIEMPKEGPNRLPGRLSCAEVEVILNEPDVTAELGVRDRAILEVFYSCGLRRSELASLSVRDVDIGCGTLLVRKGKGGKPRLIPIGERAALWVGKYQKEWRKGEQSDGALFLSEKGKALSAGAIGVRVRKYIRAAGIGKEGNCHLLRHAMATHMLENGADIRYIQEMLGHERLESTEIYTKVSIESLKEVHERTHPGDLISPEKAAPSPSGGPYQRVPRAEQVSVTPISESYWKQTSAPGSLRTLGKQFWQGLQLKGYSLATVQAHKRRLKYFLVWCAQHGLYWPGELRKAAIIRYQAHLVKLCKGSGLPLSGRYLGLMLSTVSLYLKWLEQKGHILGSLAVFIEMPNPTPHIPAQILSLKEVRALLSQPDITTPLGLRNRAILETFYSTGIRRKELIELNVEHLSASEGTVRVVAGKGGKERIIPIGKKALAWVQRYLDEARPRLLLRAGEPALFISKEGRRLSSAQTNVIVTKLIKEAKIEKKGSCHILRHSMATHMLENGADIRYIQEMLGHVRLNSTQIYTKVSIRKLKEVHSQTHPAKLKPAR